MRTQLAAQENVPAYIVLSDATLVELATYLPHTPEEFHKISGFGELKIQKYAKPFGDVVLAYCKDKHLKSRVHLKVPKRQRRERPERETETKQQSFELFQQGNPIEKIADLRGLSPTTIEGHLAFYVQQGKIDLDQLVEPSKIQTIREAIKKTGGVALTPIKESLGDAFSFGEIRFVMADASAAHDAPAEPATKNK